MKKCGKICTLLCFTPCPKNLIEHIAFQPPSPSYGLEYNREAETYSLQPDRLKQMLTKDVKIDYAVTKYNTKIVCLYFPANTQNRPTILYSHGNGSDLGTLLSLIIWLSNQVACNILAYDYSGYGQSTGKPSEKRMYADVEAAYNLLRTKYKSPAINIILMGQSLGSAATLHLAAKVNVRGVIIQSGLTSALNVAFPREQPRTMCCDVFDNLSKLERIQSPTLVIHGTDDDVIDISHGETIFTRCPRAVEPLWIHRAGHNDVELHLQYVHRLRHFINVETNVTTD